MQHCLCCHDKLLKHVVHAQVYWYCPTCRERMPQHSSKIETLLETLVQAEETAAAPKKEG